MDFNQKANGLPPHARTDRLHFFKYMHETTAKIVLNDATLRWSTSSYLNDPFDMNFEMALHADIATVKEEALGKAWDLINSEVPIKAVSPIGILLESIRVERPKVSQNDFNRFYGNAIDVTYQKMKESLPRTNGDLAPLHAKTKILSLSERADIPTMWSHYANSHRGVVLRFRSINDAPYMMAKPMRYTEDVPHFLSHQELVDFFCGLNAISPEALADLVTYTKSSHWSYEKEWRIASGFGRDDSLPFEDVQFGYDELDGVIFGLNTSRETIDVVKLLSAKFPAVQFFRASRQPTSFKLEISPLL